MTHRIASAFTVRSYEADPYGHLNNGVYVSWFEQGRLDYLMSLGFSYDVFAERREWFVVARVEIDYKLPLHVGDRVVVTTEVTGFGTSSVRLGQTMHLAAADGSADSSRVASQATVVMVFTDNVTSIPIPADFRAAVAAGVPVG